jgi:hypothetical protein
LDAAVKEFETTDYWTEEQEEAFLNQRRELYKKVVFKSSFLHLS